MEEIYRPEHTERIETHSADNRQDMLGDLPGWLIYTGSYIVYGLIALLIVGGAVFQYPDVIEQPIQIDETGSVEWITANHSGMIDRFLVKDGAEVKAGDTLGILKNTASLRDVQIFCLVLTNVECYYRTYNADYLRQYPFDLIMGEMTPAYEQFTEAARSCLMYHDFDVYARKKRFLKEEMRILEAAGETDALVKLRLKREMFELDAEHERELGRNARMLELAYENMVNQLKTWESKYLIKCKHDGIVTWGKKWGIGERRAEGDTLCTVLSQQRGTPVGHIRLTEVQVSEISVGDKVNIALNKYPAHTYGKLTGEVVSISFIPHNKHYAVEVAFPHGLVTSNGRKVEYTVGLTGQAEIVTASKTVMSRIFEPVRQIFEL